MSKKQKKVLVRIIVALVLLAGVILLDKLALLPQWAMIVLYLVPYFVIGYDILWKALKGIKNRQVFDENFLMAVATVGALCLQEFKEGVAVMLFYQIGELFQRHGAQVDTFAGTHSNGSCLNFPVANNQEIGNLEQSMLADFKADFFVSQVRLGTESALVESFLDFQGEIGLLVSDIHDHRLGRCQPGRERTGVVLDEHADEALEGAEDGTV